MLTVCSLLPCKAQNRDTKLLGNLPQIYLDFDQKTYAKGVEILPEVRTALLEFNEKKITQDQLVQKFYKLSRQTTDSLAVELAQAVNAEMVNLEGKELSYKISDALASETPWYQITSAPSLFIDSSQMVGVKVNIKDNDIAPDEVFAFAVFIIYVTANGDVIDTATIDSYNLGTNCSQNSSSKTYNDISFGSIDIASNPELWDALDQVIFCTEDERDAAEEQTFENQQKYSKERTERNNDLATKAMPGFFE